MFGDLKAIVDVIKMGVETAGKIKDSRKREEAVLDLLRIYFILMDVVDDGFSLLKGFEKYSVSNYCNLTKEQVREKIDEWNLIVYKQTIRLRNLSDKLLAQDVLSIIDPSLKKQIADIVGSKFENANSLHSIGAYLLFNLTFRFSSDEEVLINIVNAIYKADARNIINISESREQLNKLGEALEKYRNICLRLVTESEVLILSNKAREETIYFKTDSFSA